MTTTTARHDLPLLVPGQAQKEMFHNESLVAIDALLHPAVEAVGTNTPPVDPAEGLMWIVGSSPSADWAGRANALAAWTGGGWRFHAPAAGMRCTNRASGLQAAWDGAAWRVGELRAERLVIGGEPVVGGRRPGIPDPVGGATIDAEARAAVAAIVASLRGHGLIA